VTGQHLAPCSCRCQSGAGSGRPPRSRSRAARSPSTAGRATGSRRAGQSRPCARGGLPQLPYPAPTQACSAHTPAAGSAATCRTPGAGGSKQGRAGLIRERERAVAPPTSRSAPSVLRTNAPCTLRCACILLGARCAGAHSNTQAAPCLARAMACQTLRCASVRPNWQSVAAPAGRHSAYLSGGPACARARAAVTRAHPRRLARALRASTARVFAREREALNSVLRVTG